MTWTTLPVPAVGDDDTTGAKKVDTVFNAYRAGIEELRDFHPDDLDPVAWTPRLVVADANGYTNTTASSVSIATSGVCTKAGHTFADGMKVITSALAGGLTGIANNDQWYITDVVAGVSFKLQDGRGNPTPETFGGTSGTATFSTVGHGWTPSAGSGGTNPSLGAGVATGLAWRLGKWCMADFTIPFGAGGTAGSGAYRISLPWPAREDRCWEQQPVGSGHIVSGTLDGAFGELGPGAHLDFHAHVAPSVTSDVAGIVLGSLTPVNGLASAYEVGEAITAASVTAGTATFTVANSYAVSDTIRVTGMTPSGYDGEWTVATRSGAQFTVTGFAALAAGSAFGIARNLTTPAAVRSLNIISATLADVRTFLATLGADMDLRIGTNRFDNCAHNVPWDWADGCSLRGTLGYWID